MSTLREIEAAVESLPLRQQEALFRFLATRLGRGESTRSEPSSNDSKLPPHSVLDIPTAHLGQMLSPMSSDDDILGEMLEYRA